MQSEEIEERVYPKRPTLTAEERQRRCEMLAFDLVERKLENGSATSQEIVHFLKLATAREQAETERIQAEVRLAEAKINSIESTQKLEESTNRVLSALLKYQGTTYSNNTDEEEYEDEF